MAFDRVQPETETARRSALEVYLLGLVDFAQIEYLQHLLVRRVKLAREPVAYLIIVEHPPVLTVGRQGSRAHITVDDRELRALGLETRWVARGGGVTVHSPGQLAAYCVLSLREHRLSLRAYLDALRAVAVSTVTEFDIAAETFSGHEGVWFNRRRLGAVGVGVSNYVTTFGLTLNVSARPDWWELVDGPGLFDGQVTAMTLCCRRWLDMAAVREALVSRFERHFGFQRQHLYTFHPLVTRRLRRPVYAGSLD